jgi:SAM-dependent methyltransferase
MDGPRDSSDQLEYWNGAAGERWACHQASIDRAFGPLGREALDRLAPLPGERILDVGCGSGATLSELAGRVGDSGEVVGIDISRPLLERARVRVGGAPNVQLTLADASNHAFDGRFDAVFSRLGVMFFADPVSAFQNLRRALVPGGRLVFVCWQSLEDNAWCSVPLAVALPVLVNPPPDRPPHAPGPFAFADPRHVRRVLAGAGFSRIEVSSQRAPVLMSDEGLDAAIDFAVRIGPVARVFADQPEPTAELIRQRLRSALAPTATARTVTLDGAVWLVSARG